VLAQRAASEGWEGSRQTILLARRTRTMKLCSFDARSEGQSGDSLRRESVMLQRRKQEALARASGTSRRASGWAGEKAARSGGLIRVIPGNVHEQAGKNHLWSLAAALLGTRRVSARQGWAGEKSGLFEHPAGDFYCCATFADHRSSRVPTEFFRSLLGYGVRPGSSQSGRWLRFLSG